MAQSVKFFNTILLLFAIVFGVRASEQLSANSSDALKEKVAQADEMQNSGQFEDALTLFIEARSQCQAEQGEYNSDMQYILGSIATCAYQLQDYQLYNDSYLQVESIAEKIGYDSDIYESIVCYELANYLLDFEQQPIQWEKIYDYIERGSAKADTEEMKANWDAFLHKANYVKASENLISNDNEEILKNSFLYFTEECPMPAEIISSNIFESGLLYSQNLSNIGYNNEALEIVDKTESILKVIYPEFSSYDLDLQRLFCYANLFDTEHGLPIGERMLKEMVEDENNYLIYNAVKYNLAKLLNVAERDEEAYSHLQAIKDSPYYSRFNQMDMLTFDSYEALVLFELGEYAKAEEICQNILKADPSHQSITTVYNILSEIASVTSGKMDVSFIDDFTDMILAGDHKMQTGFIDLIITYSQNYRSLNQLDKANALLDRAMQICEFIGEEADEYYFTALIHKLVNLIYTEDMSAYMLTIKEFENGMARFNAMMQKNTDIEKMSFFHEGLLMYLERLNYLLFSAYYESQHYSEVPGILIEQMETAPEKIDGFVNLIKAQLLDEEYKNWLIDNIPDRLGRIYFYMSQIYRARHQFDEELTFFDRVIPTLPDSCEFKKVLEINREFCFLDKGEIAGHEEFIKSRYDANVSELKSMMNTLTGKGRNDYWMLQFNEFAAYTKFAFNGRNNPEVNKTAYDAALISKGLLLQSELDFINRIYRSEDNALIEKYEQWVNASEQGSADADKMEREILRTLDSKFQSDIFKIGWHEVKQSLRDNEYAVEFRGTSDYGQVQYVALIISKDSEAPTMIPLFTCCELTDLYVNEKCDYYGLSRLLWQKLNVIPEGATIYFSPEMQLHSLPLENIPDYEDRNRLISDRWHLYRLSSTRELAKTRQASPRRGVEIYGGFEYSMDKSELLSDFEANKTAYRSSDQFAIDTRGSVSTVRDLPGAKREVAAISQLIGDAGINLHSVTGSQGTEARFKATAGRKGNVMHISTHGFYFNPEADRYGRMAQILGLNSESDNSYDMALNTSGLMMAGVNESITGRVKGMECEDGILTAKEISMLNLDNIELAVLSACETGIGTISGDGVFGLQRGFKLAGVKTIMMSLWKVDDNATEKLMTEFYKNWLETEDSASALKTAQECVRSFPEWEDPEYWSGFILLDGISEKIDY